MTSLLPVLLVVLAMLEPIVVLAPPLLRVVRKKCVANITEELWHVCREEWTVRAGSREWPAVLHTNLLLQ